VPSIDLIGTLTGSFVFRFVQVVHRDGTTNAHAQGSFVGTTACGAGTVPFEFNATGTATTTFGHVVSNRQSDNTAGIHLQLDTVAAPVGPFTYSGTYHCGS